MGAIGEGGVPRARTVRCSTPRRDHAPRSSPQVEAPRAASSCSDARVDCAPVARGPARRRTVILVDDGLATGQHRARRDRGRARVGRVARGVGGARSRRRTPSPSCRPSPMRWCAWSRRRRSAAIGQWYRDFSPTTDDEVVRLLDIVSTGSVSRERAPGAGDHVAPGSARWSGASASACRRSAPRARPRSRAVDARSASRS